MNILLRLVLTLALSATCTTAVWAASENNGRKPNNLLGAQSPYLQQHIYNAVDWYPWGDEALEKAKRENKPIFLSVGYSTCHWCHVMARESFDDDKIGSFVNQHFVAIKVDRERRPDLDEQFMLATQALTGRGGWPNSVFMTSQAKPFYAATYLPPDAFLDILGQVEGLWKNDQPTLEQEGERITTGILSYMNRTEAAQNLTPVAIKEAVAEIVAQVDYFSGGIGAAPKFPQESALLLLLNQAERGDSEALEVVKGALDGMLKGGIHDHVGGGFHRYSVDANWLVPHFEKMLYNQAMIGRLLVRTYRLTGDYRYKHTATRLFDYVVREMQSKNGGFFSAQDADSLNKAGQKEEGVFYVWSKHEFDKLNDPALQSVKQTFGVTEKGNFEGHNILHLKSRIDELAKKTNTDEVQLYDKLDTGLDYLRSVREKNRHAPHKDEKIVVSWNAMMIETMALAATVLNRPDYWKAAKRSADYIVGSMLQKDGLKRVSFEGNIGVDGQLADYAGLGVALLALEENTPDDHKTPEFTETAVLLAEKIRKKFADQTELEGKPFQMTSKAEGLGGFAPVNDNPIPSGNSLTLQLFDQIAKRKGDLEFKKRSKVLTATLSGYALASPQSRGTLVNTTFSISQESVGSIRYIANGNVRVGLRLDREKNKFHVNIKMKDGWHINSNKPLEQYFVPTILSIRNEPVDPKNYPKPLEKKLKFNGKVLSLYENTVALNGSYLEETPNQLQTVSLDIQACSDEICLEPETLNFNFWSN